MVSCKEIIAKLEQFAPPHLAESWDNVGLLVGNSNAEIVKVLVSLDLLNETIDEAISIGANMIVCHHPTIFKGVTSVNDQTATGKRLLKLIKHDICVYCAHTNLDIAYGGTNDVLFDTLGLLDRETLMPNAPNYNYGLGRVGNLKMAMTLDFFARFVQTCIDADFVTFCGDNHTIIKRVALCTGSCGNVDFFKQAVEVGAQVYITGDLSYHNAQAAADLSLCVVDAGHYFTENIVCESLQTYLLNCFKDGKIDVVCSKVKGQIMKLG